jgi:RNA polymerase sigma-54 factor
MKQSLQLKLGQQLTMTPQLQQAIRLLQLSTLELQQEIQEALESNPMLEMQEESDAAPANEASNDTPAKSDSNTEREQETDSPEWQENIPNELPVDSNWEDVYQSSPPATASTAAGSETDFDFESRNGSTDTLQDHLRWQLNLTPMSDIDRLIALAIIDATGSSGMLATTLEDIHLGFDEELEIELDEVVAVQHRIQQFDPIGAASLDLQDCLLVQLRQLPADTPALKEAQLIIEKHIELLGSRDYTQLMRRSRLKESQLKAAIELIQQMNPYPGEQIDSDSTEYVIPDVFVSKKENRWVVELNPDIAPKLGINNSYAAMVKRADTSSDNNFLRDNLQEARWFLKSLQSRNETLMKVASCIVQHQRGFLEYGEEAMKPLVLHDIAQAVEMHESTISRVTTNKYMHTPRGIVELKYFFSSHVSTATGGECSSTAIRAIVKKLVAAENPKKPLSDSKIALLLKDQGINVARRTIAKYRESLAIPPSNERKRLV